MSSVLYIAAKAPRAGLVKTRLGQAIGYQEAATLYRAFLRDLATRFADAPFEIGWFVTPRDAWHDIEPVVGLSERPSRVVVQGDCDWTDRQRELFRGAALRGEERLAILASDSPHITVELVARAFQELDRHDIVIGPVYDGGYYLFGMRGWHDVLDGIPMSTSAVADHITARAQAVGLSIAQVETTFDIDEVDDLRHLQQLARVRDDLAATRAALEALGFIG